MAYFDLHERWAFANRLLSIVLILLTITVSVPLAIKTFQEGGGPWGFGIVGLHVLLPLSTYFLFGVSGMLKNKSFQWWTFVTAQLTSLLVGFAGFILFPVLPMTLLLVAALLAVLTMINKKRFQLFLSVMLVLGIACNLLLLKWELDFGRTLPILHLFESESALELVMRRGDFNQTTS